jgi:hypothetical protein
MRSALLPLLVFAGVACSSFGPSALAETPASPPFPRVVDARPPVSPGPRIEIVDDEMRALPTFAQVGRRFVLGEVGERYRVRIVNPTPGRVEAVVSVDGLDAVDGRPASLAKRGYLVPAFGEVTVEGWRTSLDTVAAFRFSSVPASYSARTGHDQNVGVIGVAFFRERQVAVVYPPRARGARPTTAPDAPAPASPPAPSPARKYDASGAGSGRATEDESRPGLGTEFGEQHDSQVTEVSFERASARPDSIAELRYDDRDGLLARGIRVAPRDARESENDRRDRAEPFPETRFAQPPP